MHKTFLVIGTLVFWAASSLVASDAKNISDKFEMVPHSAEYQKASWDNLIRIERNISMDKAYQIAHEDPEINYFFHTIGWHMVLDTPKGLMFFGPGDTVFFTGKPWWGTAFDLAHGYVKK